MTSPNQPGENVDDRFALELIANYDGGDPDTGGTYESIIKNATMMAQTINGMRQIARAALKSHPAAPVKGAVDVEAVANELLSFGNEVYFYNDMPDGNKMREAFVAILRRHLGTTLEKE